MPTETPWNPMTPGLPPGFRSGTTAVTMEADAVQEAGGPDVAGEVTGPRASDASFGGSMPDETGDGFYGDGFNGEPYDPTPLNGNGGVSSGGADVTLAVAGAPIVIGIAWLARMGFGLSVTALRPLVGRGVMAWSSLPRWLQIVLAGVGIPIGADLLIDEGEGDFGILPSPVGLLPGLPAIPGLGGGGRKGELEAFIQVRVVNEWNANGVRFYQLADGRLAVQNKRGVWKVWRPKKPIVLYADGSKDLRTLLRADRVLQKQAGKIAKMLRSRGYKVSRS